MRVTLTQSETLLARTIATMRRISNVANRVRDVKQSPIDPFEADYVGVLGEFAFCKAMGVYPDLSIEPRAGSCDAVVKGVRCDVKARRRRSDGPTDLLITLKRNVDVDVYVLAVLHSDSDVDLVGKISRARACVDRYRVDLGRGEGYLVPAADLAPLRADIRSAVA